jgi:flagellar basal body-associated protein FliL
MTTAMNPPSPAPPPPPSRSIWIALILIGAVIVGAAAGLLAYAGGNNVPVAVLPAAARSGRALCHASPKSEPEPTSMAHRSAVGNSVTAPSRRSLIVMLSGYM